jgi:hypothetical protein
MPLCRGSAALGPERGRRARADRERPSAGATIRVVLPGLHRLIHEGKIKRLPPKEPRSAIYAAMLFGKYPDEIRATKPPNQVFQALALVGRALRFKI